MSQQSAPDYLNRNIDWLNSQWKAIIENWVQTLHENSEYGLSEAISSKIDAVSLEGLKRQGRILLGNHQYNASTILGLLKQLSEEPDSVSPPVGETCVSLDDFIKSTITTVAATQPNDQDPTHIKLFITDDQPVTRLLNQAEINWFFTGHYNPANQQPIMGLQDPQRGPVTVSELIHIYNVFFKPSQTRSGRGYGMGGGGKTIKRRKAQRVTKMSRRRFLSKRTTQSLNRRRATHRRRATRTRRN